MSTKTKTKRATPKTDPHHRLQPDRRLHLTKKAVELADIGKSEGGPDDLLTSEDVAKWIGTSQQFVELGRLKGYGPRYTRLSPRVIRYRRCDVIKWLESRTHASTAEYA